MLRLASPHQVGRWLFIAGLALGAACSDNSVTNSISPLNAFNQTRLVEDVTGEGAPTTDPNLVNPWGIAFGPTGILWVANNGTGTSTLYDANGNPFSLVVSIPAASFLASGTPTGIVLNSTSSFVISGGPAIFLFAGEDGSVSAWNQSSNDARLVINRSANGAVYKGIAIGSVGSENRLYLTNFANNRVDMFDAAFNLVSSFTDPNIPAGYGPFGIENVNGKLFVTFARIGTNGTDDVPGVGNGFVDIFNTDGSVLMRFASNGTLNSPWGIAMAPAGFGAFAGDILVGNFGDGKIGAYDASSGKFIDFVRDANQNTITIDGLWGLAFGPGAGSTSLYFSAGAGEETHGIVGTVTPK